RGAALLGRAEDGRARFRPKPPTASGTGSAGKMLVGDLPGIAVGGPFLADPMEAVGGDLGETPSRFQAARVLADLDNVLALGPPDLTRIILVERVAPDDVPAAYAGIEDAQSRTVHGGRGRALRPDPDILDGAAFQHPAEMDFSSRFLGRAVVEMADGLHFPASDQPSIEVHVFRPVSGRSLRSEGGEKRRYR